MQCLLAAGTVEAGGQREKQFKEAAHLLRLNRRKVRETLNQSTFCGKPAQLCDAGRWKIKGLA